MNPELSNASLVLTLAPTTCAATPQGPPADPAGQRGALSASALPFNPSSPRGLTFPVHDTVLASGSQYFRARLLRWEGGPRSRSRAGSAGNACSTGSISNGCSSRPYGYGPSTRHGGPPARSHQQYSSFQNGYPAGCDRAQHVLDGAACAAAGAGAHRAEAAGVGPRELVEPCSRQELQAAQDVLEFMYTNQLNRPNDMSHLLMMCTVADRWVVPDCVDACIVALTWQGHQPQQQELLGPGHISAILAEQPASVTGHPLYPKLQHMCGTRMRSLFSPVYAVVPDLDRLAAFCSLSFPALKLWAADGSLVTDSENTIAVLVTHWWHAQCAAGAAPLADQLHELSCLVRLRQLTATFLAFVLPQLPWFQPPTDALPLFHALHQYPRAAKPNEKLLQKLPSSWMAGMRMPADINKASVQWTIPRDELSEIVARAVGYVLVPRGIVRTHEVSGPCLYWGGFLWQLLLHFSCPPAGRGCDVLVGWRVLSALDTINLCNLTPPAVAPAAAVSTSAAARPVHGAGRAHGRRSSGGGTAHQAQPNGAHSAATSSNGSASRSSSNSSNCSGHSSRSHLPFNSAGGDVASAPTTDGRALPLQQPGMGGRALNSLSLAMNEANGRELGTAAAAAATPGRESECTLQIPMCEAVAAKVTLSCKEAATGGYTRRFTVDMMGGMCGSDMAGRPNFFSTTVFNVDDLAPYIVQDKLQLCLQLESHQ